MSSWILKGDNVGESSSYTPLDTSGFCEALRDRTFDPRALIAWARRYDGYKRLGGSPSALVKVLDPLVEEIAASGKIPEWAGVDLLRGLAFWRVRVAANREAPEYALDDDLFLATVDAVHKHPNARPADRPPL
ncbi:MULTISPECIES: hypothetical protein [Mycobacterium]|uniref:hypothetical protein n=1 Tax=Mycobacterium TaxID=1763 RepID=UPI001EF327FA|nr:MULTISPECIES: hypothetical protein [Mycobacterium]